MFHFSESFMKLTEKYHMVLLYTPAVKAARLSFNEKQMYDIDREYFSVLKSIQSASF